MSTRELITPSRSLRSERAAFKLQPPPLRRNKANRKCSVITGANSGQENDTKVPLLMTASGSSSVSKQKLASTEGFYTIENNSMPSIFEDDDDTATTCSFKEAYAEITVHPSDRSERRKRSTQTITIEGSKHCGVLVTSPLMSGNRMCESPLAIGSKDRDTNADRTPKSTTSSYFNLARNSFGASLRKRTSQPMNSDPTRKSTKSSAASHTVVCLSPRSPLTPRSRFSLQSPKIQEGDVAGTFVVFPRGGHVEAGPLSATLKSLGVVRDTSDDVKEKVESPTGVKSDSMEAFETRLAHRVFLHERAQYAKEENRQRAQDAESLFKTRHHLSPDHDTSKLFVYDSGLSPYPPQVGGRVQSTVRGGQQRSTLQASFIRLSTLFSGYKIPSRQDPKLEMKTAVHDNAAGLLRPEPALPKKKGDGWGGLLPRQSWFEYGTLGPLASPCVSPTKSTHLRPLMLQANTPSKLKEEEVWVDDEPFTAVDHSPIVEVEDRTLQKLRVRFPDYTPKSSRIAAEMSNEAKAHEEALAVTYTSTSAEGRPVNQHSMKEFLELHYGMIVSILIILAIAIAILIIALSAVKRHQNA